MILVKSPKKQKNIWHIAKGNNRVKTLCNLPMPVNYLNIHYPNFKVAVCRNCQFAIDLRGTD